MNEVAQELIRIRDLYGDLQPQTIVQEAANPASPIHSRFTWDDSQAAHQYRLQQARALVRVVVAHFPANTDVQKFRVYVSMAEDRIKPGGGYRVMTEVLDSPTERAQLLAQALLELRRLQAKYRDLQEVAAAIAAAIAQMTSPPAPEPDAATVPSPLLPPPATGGADVAVL